MKIRVRVRREFRFQLSEAEFTVLQDALYEHGSAHGVSLDDRNLALTMREQINDALRAV